MKKIIFWLSVPFLLTLGIFIIALVSTRALDLSLVEKSFQPSIITAAGPGGGPHIRAFNQRGQVEAEPNLMFAYGQNFHGGVYITTGDIDKDGFDEIITAPRQGGGPQVRVFEKNGQPKAVQFWPFHPDSRSGVSIATGDIDNDGQDDIAMVPATGDQARVKIYQYGEEQKVLAEWIAFGSVACGGSLALADLNGDDQVEILVAAGPGGGPQVQIFNYTGRLIKQFFAFEASYRGGLDITVGDLDGDGLNDEIVVAKRLESSLLKVFQYNDLPNVQNSFKAFANFSIGALVEVADINQDGQDEIITGVSRGGGPQVRVFNQNGQQLSNLNFFAYDPKFRGGTDVAVGNFTLTSIEAPVIDLQAPITTAIPEAGTYSTTKNITLGCDDGSGVGCAYTFYTTDGSDPDYNSTIYSIPINLSATTTLKYFSVDQAGNDEVIKTNAYTIITNGIDNQTPTTSISPAAGTYYNNQIITLACVDNIACATTYYTINDSNPTISSSIYSEPLIIGTTTTIKYFSIDQIGNEEAVHSAEYIIFTDDHQAPTTSASPAGGTYSSIKNVTLTCDDSSGSGCLQTYYTTAGSDPTTASSVYNSAINISQNTTLKFFSVDLAGNQESIKIETYTIQQTTDTTPPITTASPPAGEYNGPQTITLTCTDGFSSGCASTYYTTDGSEPTTASTVYSSPVYLLGTTTLKYFSVDQAGNEETIKIAIYTLGPAYTILTIGDSITAGAPYAGTANTYPAQMGVLLDEQYGADYFAVINRGISGHRADEIYDDMVNQGWLSQDNPDIVLLIVGGNDLSQGQSIASTIIDVQNIIDYVISHTNIDSTHPQIIVSAMIPNLVDPQPLATLYLALYNSNLEANLTDYNYWFTTNWQDFYDSGTGSAKTDLMADSVHPNVAGYGIMANNWLEVINTLIAN